VAPDFPRYRAFSRIVREIFKRHTDLIEPLSLDEAYLDVTENKMGFPTATLVAKTIREQIRQELNLTASAGVAPNKFLAELRRTGASPMGCSSSGLRTSKSFCCHCRWDGCPELAG
jgi:DNA polymerase IV